MSTREPVPKSTDVIDPHIFAADEDGARDWRLPNRPIDCLYCPFPEGNAIHVTSSELVADLPPTPPEDRSNEIIGEGNR